MADLSYPEFLLNEALKQNLRTILNSVNTPRASTSTRPIGSRITSNFFDDLKENVREIQATHYSPAKLDGDIPDLTPRDPGDGLKPRVSGSNLGSSLSKAKTATDSRHLEDEFWLRNNKTEVKTDQRHTAGPKPTRWHSTGNEDDLERSGKPYRNSHHSSTPREWTQLLITKVDHQSDRIEQLEAELRELRSANYRLQESNQITARQLQHEREDQDRERERMQHELALARIERLNHIVEEPRHTERLYDFDGIDHQEDQFLESEKPHVKFDGGAAGAEVPPELHPAAFYKLRYENLYARFRRSVDISTFQARTLAKLSACDFADDDTTRLISGMGSTDSTTALILGQSHGSVYDSVYPSHKTPRSRLRKVVLAVLFTVRVQMASNRRKLEQNMLRQW